MSSQDERVREAMRIANIVYPRPIYNKNPTPDNFFNTSQTKQIAYNTMLQRKERQAREEDALFNLFNQKIDDEEKRTNNRAMEGIIKRVKDEMKQSAPSPLKIAREADEKFLRENYRVGLKPVVGSRPKTLYENAYDAFYNSIKSSGTKNREKIGNDDTKTEDTVPKGYKGRK